MSRPLVVSLVGTDHHPFDRLVDWSDVVADRFRDRAEVVVQHGYTRAPRLARGHDFLPHAELEDLLRRASVVICHGGPGTIADARRAGHVPVCVPRDPSLGEHVDGHQMRFATVVADAGVVQRAESEQQVVAVVDRLIRDEGVRLDDGVEDHPEACDRFEREVRDLLSSPARRRDPFLRALRGAFSTPRAAARRGPAPLRADGAALVTVHSATMALEQRNQS